MAHARAAPAVAGRRVVQRAVRGTHQEFCVGLEELAGLPVELHQHMRASVQVGDRDAAVSYRERGHHFAPEHHFESHSAAPVRQRGRQAEGH